MGRRRQKSSPDSNIGYVHEKPGVVKLLFETPSGFSIFSVSESFLQKKIEHIWTYFIGDFWCSNIIWLHEFRKFEDMPNAINLRNRKINPSLLKMIVQYVKEGDKLAVGRPQYKEIIEESLEIPCLYNDVVLEVMWGMQNLLRTILPVEQSEMTIEDRIPMSKGLDMVLSRHGFVVEPKLINEDIIKTANAIYDIDLRERAHSKFLRNLLAKEFMVISGVDIEDWSLFKLASAIKKMCYPDEGFLVGDPYEMFTRSDAEMIEDDGAKYRDRVDENTILTIYRDVVFLREDKRTVRNKLRHLVREAKEALEAEVLEEPATTGVNSKQQVDHTCLTVDLPAVPYQNNIGEGQHPITDAVGIEFVPVSTTTDCMETISLHDASANHITREGEVQTSSMFPQGVPEEITTLHPSKEITALGTYVEETGATPGGDSVGNSTADVKELSQEAGAETGVILEKTEGSAYVEKKMREEKDEYTDLGEMGLTQENNETEVISEKTEDIAYVEKKVKQPGKTDVEEPLVVEKVMPVKEAEKNVVEEPGAVGNELPIEQAEKTDVEEPWAVGNVTLVEEAENIGVEEPGAVENEKPEEQAEKADVQEPGAKDSNQPGAVEDEKPEEQAEKADVQEPGAVGNVTLVEEAENICVEEPGAVENEKPEEQAEKTDVQEPGAVEDEKPEEEAEKADVQEPGTVEDEKPEEQAEKADVQELGAVEDEKPEEQAEIANVQEGGAVEDEKPEDQAEIVDVEEPRAIDNSQHGGRSLRSGKPSVSLRIPLDKATPDKTLTPANNPPISSPPPRIDTKENKRRWKLKLFSCFH